MKLKLKHLAGYLPYGLQIYFESLDGENKSTWTLSYNEIDFLLRNRNKPILRPLSDLTKDNVLEIIEYSDFENIYFNGNPSDLIFINTEDKTYLSDISKNMEFLFKNHFDIYGLIEKGLAVDINTLKL